MPIYYIDNNRGNDSNDGLSPLTPWKNPAKITAFASAQPGDAFLLSDDAAWVLSPTQRIVPATSWRGTQHNPVIIGKYSPSSQSIGNRPLITLNATTVAGDWTYDALLNGWKYVYPTAHINNAVLLRLADSWLASAIDNPADGPVETVDGRYLARTDNQTLVLYAPAGVNPVDYYGKVVVGAQAAGAITLSSGRYWITVQDIAFTETGCGVLCYSQDANPAGFVVERCRMDAGGALATIGGASPGNVRAWVRDNEVYDFAAIGIHCNSSGGAGIAYAEIYRNRIDSGVRQWAQGGIYLQCRNTARASNCFVHDNELSRCSWGTKDKVYDGCAIYLETGSDGIHVYRNTVHDCFVALQDNSGRRNYVYGNLIYDCRRGIRVTDQSDNRLSELFLDNNTFMVGDLQQNATQFGDTIQGADYPAVWSLSGDDAIKINARNNIFANVGGQRGRAVFGLAQIATTYDIRNNWVFGFETDVLNGANNLALASPPTVSNAGTIDPRPYMDAGYALKSYGYTAVSPNPLATVGAYLPNIRLMNGRMRPGWCPVGAYQAVAPRADRTFADTRGATESILTEDGLNLLTEDGDILVVE